MTIFAYLFVLFLFTLPLIIYRKVYLRPISVINLDGELNVTFSSIRPSKAFYREFGGGYPVSSITTKGGYCILFVPGVSDYRLYYSNNLMCFRSNVILLKRSKFGRFRSVDLSDRCLFDILSQFKV